MKWTRGRTLGRGSTAIVSIAEACKSGQVFAVKSAELHNSELLKREQRILSTLKCPQIVAYKGCDVTWENGAMLYNLFMEYAPYGTLSDAIRKRNGGLDEDLVRIYARQILLGLNHLHCNGIVHCDVKGQNVLVTEEGAKVADLGCARRIAEVADSDWVIAGTPVFMAPEVARGEQQGFPADVWALGCTVLEMANGKAPWHDVSDPVTAIYRIGFSGEVPEIPSFMSEQGRDFLSKCLMSDPKERWSVGQLLQHGFVQESSSVSKEFDGFNSDTPTSVLERSIWDTMGELQTTLDSTHNCSWKSPTPRDRVRRLCAEATTTFVAKVNWEWNENWVTVRSNGFREIQMFPRVLESNVPKAKANEKTETCGSDTVYIWEDNGLEIYDPNTVITIGFSTCIVNCNVSYHISNLCCCNYDEELSKSPCKEIVPKGKNDSQIKKLLPMTCFLLHVPVIASHDLLSAPSIPHSFYFERAHLSLDYNDIKYA